MRKSTEHAIETYEHKGEKRLNNPPVGLVTPDTDPDVGAKGTYSYDPHLDPQLQWCGKAEHTSFEVPTVSLHVHERIEPRTILEAVRKRNGEAARQPSLFEMEERPLREAIEFYKHKDNWTNRLIAGDSLLVMNSLLEKEGMAGKVQMIYIDPPYGLKYGSNFQPFVNKRDVIDGKDEDLTSEPEQIRAFRDTWELGIHSYLTYLRDRLLLARELLDESGSVFVQISDENVHHVWELMAEVFGAGNFVRLITFAKTGSMVSSELGRTSDYLLWYARDKQHLKYHQLFDAKLPDAFYSNVELSDGSSRKITRAESVDPSLLPAGARVFRLVSLESSGPPKEDTPFEFEGEVFRPNKNSHWKLVYPHGMNALGKSGRIVKDGNKLRWKYYIDDYPLKVLSEVWSDTAGFNSDQRYVVETRTKVVERCILMTTDPGDLVFDPTCGAGTTAYVAERRGRRWITCDTSRVALTLARQRLMTAVFDYYELAHPQEGVGSGFKYKTVPHVTLKSIANNPDIREGMTREQIDAAIARHADQETLYDQPLINGGKVRVSGPFTVEAVPAPAVKSVQELLEEAPPPADVSIARSGETLRQTEWRDELFRSGIRGKAGQYIRFARLEPIPGYRWLHADGETRPSDEGADSVREEGTAYAPQRVVVSFGPEHAPLEQRQVELAINDAQTLAPRPKLIVFAAFQFDPEAAKDIDETNWPGVTLLKVQMNADLLTDDLKKKRAGNESFWLIGQPDVVVASEKWIVDDRKEVLAPYDVVAKLSGAGSVAEINDFGRDDLSVLIAIVQRRDLWDTVANEQRGGLDFSEHRRGTSEAEHGRVSSVFGYRTGIPGRIGDSADFVRELESLTETNRRNRIEGLRRNREIAERTRKITASLTGQLSTIHYSQVTIHGFDYYNTKTGQIESGGADKIAVWLLDTDYDGRSLYPRQVFFPMADQGEGWAKLARNLKAEIDKERVEVYRGTVSLPFEPGEHKRIAVKIVDDRGIESLKVLEVD